jgi:hypothetical protein
VRFGNSAKSAGLRNESKTIESKTIESKAIRQIIKGRGSSLIIRESPDQLTPNARQMIQQIAESICQSYP